MASATLRHLTPEIMDKCRAMEDAPTRDYLIACRFLVPYSERYGNRADDVASVARIILADVMESGLAGSMAAGAAVKRAATWQVADEIGESDRPMVRTVPAGDTRESLTDEIDASTVDAPDRIARWTRRDTLAQVWERMDETGRAIMGDLRHADVWGGQGAAGINVSALARRAYGTDRPSGPVRKALASALGEALADMRAVGRSLPREALPTMPTGLDPMPGTLRDTRVPTSGPASAVVVTSPSGHWITLADHSVKITAEARAYVLAQHDTMPAYDGGRVAEVTRASLDAAWEIAATMPARRPAGVPAGARYGVRIAGNGTPEPRPQGSRRRKRDGGIGSPMVPA